MYSATGIHIPVYAHARIYISESARAPTARGMATAGAIEAAPAYRVRSYYDTGGTSVTTHTVLTADDVDAFLASARAVVGSYDARIRDLSLDIAGGCPDTVLEQLLAGLPELQLRTLSFCEMMVGPYYENIQRLYSVLTSAIPPQLESLDLFKAHMLGTSAERLGAYIKTNKRLRSLCVRDLSVTDQSTGLEVPGEAIALAIADHAGLDQVTLHIRRPTVTEHDATGRFVGVFTNVLSRHAHIKCLDFSGTAFRGDSDTGVADIIKRNTVLTRLEIASCSISAGGVTELAQALVGNSVLRTLSLANNRTMETRGFVEILNALNENSALTFLSLGDCHLGADGGAALARMLCRNRHVTGLDIRNTEVDDAGAIALGTAFAKNTTLTTVLAQRFSNRGDCIATLLNGLFSSSSITSLNISGSCITDANLAALSPASEACGVVPLARNTTLRTLFMAHCTMFDAAYSFGRRNLVPSMGDIGIAHLAAALRVNSTLTDFVFAGNWCTLVGAQALCTALTFNTSLRKLALDGWTTTPRLENAGAVLFSNLLATNMTLTEISLNGHGITSEGCAVILAGLAKNMTLRRMLVDNFEPAGMALITELVRRYRAPHVRFVVRVRVMCQTGRARATVARTTTAAWLCENAPLWVVVHVCALLREARPL